MTEAASRFSAKPRVEVHEHHPAPRQNGWMGVQPGASASASAVYQKQKARILPAPEKPITAAIIPSAGGQKAVEVFHSQINGPPKEKTPIHKSFRIENMARAVAYRVPTLEQLLEKRAFRTLGIPLQDSIAIAGQILEGLTALAKANRVHRNIDCTTIAYDPVKKKAILTQCDRSIAIHQAPSFYQLSKMRSPDDILGIPPNPKLDVWNLGVTLYESYTGSRLFPLPRWDSDEQENADLLQAMSVKLGLPNESFIVQGAYWEDYYVRDENQQLCFRTPLTYEMAYYLLPYSERPSLTSDIFQAVTIANKENQLASGRFYEFVMTLVGYDRPTPEQALALWKRLFVDNLLHRRLNLLWKNPQKA